MPDINYSLVIAAFCLLLFAWVSRKKVFPPVIQTNLQIDMNGLLDSLTSRALANKQLRVNLGICNSFVSDEEDVRKEFVRVMIMVKKQFNKKKNNEVLSGVLDSLPITLPLHDLAQILTMASVLSSLHIEVPSVEVMKSAARLIDILWTSQGDQERKDLHCIIPPVVLSLFIPAWESQWRVVYYALIEKFRSEHDNSQANIDMNKWIKETLRLYPPVKRVIRKDEKGKDISFPIAGEMRRKDIWGEDALQFKPKREYTPEREEKSKEIFGMGKLRCIAGLSFVQEFCGSIVEKVMEKYRASNDVEWETLPAPLENTRGLYATLRVERNV